MRKRREETDVKKKKNEREKERRREKIWWHVTSSVLTVIGPWDFAGSVLLGGCAGFCLLGIVCVPSKP